METILTIIAVAFVALVVVEGLMFIFSRIDKVGYKTTEKSILMMEEANLNLQKELGRSREQLSDLSKKFEFYRERYAELMNETNATTDILNKVVPEIISLNDYYKETCYYVINGGGQDAFEIKEQRNKFVDHVGKLLKAAEDAGIALNETRLDNKTTK